MTALFYYLLKVLAGSAIFIGYYYFALRNKAFHQWNRFYLLGATLLSLVLPLLHFSILYGSEEQSGAIRLLHAVQAADDYLEEFTVQSKPGFSPEQLLSVGYGMICLFMLLSLLVSLRKIFRIVRTHPVHTIANIKLLNTAVPGTPFSFMDYIFWNQNISLQSETGQKIFQHEVVHVQEKHTLDKLFLQFVLILFWSNPFFWLVRYELRLIHEFIADKKAVGEGGTPALAAMLLQSSYPQSSYFITSSFFQTSIKRRLLMLTKIQNPGRNYLSRIIALPLIATVAFSFTVRTKNSMPVIKLDQPLVVVIDAGHGKNEKGTFTGAKTDEIYEDQVVLNIAKKVQELNGNQNLKIVLTRNDENSLDLKKRVALIDEVHADLFISLHVNAVTPGEDSKNYSSKRLQKAIEVYVPGDNPAFQKQSEALGSVLISEFSGLYQTNANLLQRSNGIYVLNNASCPSALVECGYLTDKEDKQFLMNEANQEKIAQRILTAVQKWPTAKLLPEATDTIPKKTKEIKSVDVHTGPAKQLENITISYTDGTSETLTKQDAIKRGLITDPNKEKVVVGHPLKKDKSDAEPIFYLDGKEITKAEMQKINPNTIQSINVLKGESATQKYGSKGKNGVVEISLKADPTHNVNLEQSNRSSNTNEIVVTGHPLAKPALDENANGNNRVFEKTEIPASVDQNEWRQFLSQNLQPIIVNAASKGAKPGKYTVNVRFLVKKDGTLSDFQAMNNPGYDLEKQVLAIMPNSPKWKPAEQNGKLVTSYHTQPITFVIAEQ